MDTKPPGVVYKITSIPLSEYDIKYVYPQPSAKRTNHLCCIMLLVRKYMASYYKTNPTRK